MSHGDTIAGVPEKFQVIAGTDSVKVAAFHIPGTKTYGNQFHPEVTHSLEGKKLLENYLIDICGCARDWTPMAFIDSTIEELQQQLGNDKVVLAISGGVDSSVAVLLLQKAIGPKLHCIFRSEEHTSELQSLMRTSYAFFGLKKTNHDYR